MKPTVGKKKLSLSSMMILILMIVSKLVSAVDVLTSKLTFLQQDFDNIKQKNVKKRNFLYTKCNVRTLNKVDKCTHCYVCGVKGHSAHRCPDRSNSGN